MRHAAIMWVTMWLYLTCFIATGVALDVRDPENGRSLEHIGAALTAPLWLPGFAVFQLMRWGKG